MKICRKNGCGQIKQSTNEEVLERVNTSASSLLDSLVDLGT